MTAAGTSEAGEQMAGEFLVRPPDFIRQGQPYWLVGVQPHTRKDGTSTRLAIWVGPCATCGQQFTTKSPLANGDPRPPESRRCLTHKLPGVRVRPQTIQCVGVRQ